MTNEQLRAARIAEAKRRNGGCGIGVDCYDAFVNHLADLYETNWTPVDPDLIAAREWDAADTPEVADGVRAGTYDTGTAIRAFLAGIAHGRANP